VCGASGTVAAVTKVHCLCDLLFSFGSGKTTRKFLMDGCENFFWGVGGGCKSALECYQSLKEGLGPHASSYETVH